MGLTIMISSVLNADIKAMRDAKRQRNRLEGKCGRVLRLQADRTVASKSWNSLTTNTILIGLVAVGGGR